MAEKSLEEKLQYIRQLRPIDDVFFEVLSQDPAVVEEMLRTILEDPQLVVENVHTQDTLANVFGRAVRLDCLCTLGNGTRCNIEVQRSDNDNHFKRVRVNEAGITWKESEKGTPFEEIPDVIVIYISEFDIMGGGRTTYHVDKIVRETDEIVEDGTANIYVNTKVKDGSATSELMGLFLQKEVKDPNFPKLSGRIEYLKSNKEGVRAMCDVMERYMADEVKEIKEKYDAVIAQNQAAHEAEVAALKAEMEKLKKELGK